MRCLTLKPTVKENCHRIEIAGHYYAPISMFRYIKYFDDDLLIAIKNSCIQKQ